MAGLGAIGTEVARAVRAGEAPGVQIAAVVEPQAIPARDTLAAAGVPVHTDLATLDWDSLDAVLEAASQAALRAIAPEVLGHGVDLVALSAGATLDTGFLTSLLTAAATSGARIWVPSGAIGALDVIRASRVGHVESITLTTTKPPVALVDAPWVVEQGIDLSCVTRPRVIFAGGPVEAVRGFPQNVNVAALLALASDDPGRLRVTVVADPDAPGNVHEVEAAGSFGTMRLRLENRPSEANPKTSALAAQSVIALLRQLGSPLRFA
ncbi:MAG: aspartate dehydrogenase [Chloroflexota bacterium]|nr:aspartate dehydrogenase [Chloroflexota bacterium]MDE2898274.1 aspartate dehydrogenase [Chloroflexota bacterium]